MELYKSDFEAERSAKDALKHDKEEIADDLRSLQRRNEELLKEVERLRGSTDFVHVSSSASSSAPSAPQDVSNIITIKIIVIYSYMNIKMKIYFLRQSPPPPSYACPLCMVRFRSLRILEDHVEYCVFNTQ